MLKRILNYCPSFRAYCAGSAVAGSVCFYLLLFFGYWTVFVEVVEEVASSKDLLVHINVDDEDNDDDDDHLNIYQVETVEQLQ